MRNTICFAASELLLLPRHALSQATGFASNSVRRGGVALTRGMAEEFRRNY
jgi:hypothetical protein